jgi:hypothetical protein
MLAVLEQDPDEKIRSMAARSLTKLTPPSPAREAAASPADNQPEPASPAVDPIPA